MQRFFSGYELLVANQQSLKQQTGVQGVFQRSLCREHLPVIVKQLYQVNLFRQILKYAGKVNLVTDVACQAHGRQIADPCLEPADDPGGIKPLRPFGGGERIETGESPSWDRKAARLF